MSIMFFHLQDESLVIYGVVEDTYNFGGCLLLNWLDTLAVSLPARLTEQPAACVKIDLVCIFSGADSRFTHTSGTRLGTAGRKSSIDLDGCDCSQGP